MLSLYGAHGFFVLCIRSSVPDSPAVVSSTVWAKKTNTATGTSGGSRGDICQQIAKIIGISNVASIKQDSTLGDLGMDSLMVVEVRQALERECDLNLSIPEIRQLTFAKLKELQASNGPDEPTANGDQCNAVADKLPVLERVFKTVTVKNFLTTETVVKFIPDNKQDVNKQPIFLLPPVEGTMESLGSFIKLLKRPVYGLQITSKIKATSVAKMAEQFIAVSSLTCTTTHTQTINHW
jgi:fatty acid synthase